jgi:hypothetical protein
VVGAAAAGGGAGEGLALTPPSDPGFQWEEEVPTAAASDIFDATMRGLESGLHVAHVATFELKTCEATDDVARVLSNPSLSAFDQIPVRRDGHIVGVLRRMDGIEGKVSERMTHLDGSMLVAAQAPLMSYVRMAAAGPYRLVVGEPGVTGIVTRSDLLKLPVRLLAFTLVAHLEMLLAAIIRCRCGPDDRGWLKLLSDGRRQKLEEKRRKLRAEKLDPPLLELTEFCDKRVAVAKLLALGGDFTEQVQAIEKLRNPVAHAATYVGTDDEVKVFVERMESAQRWIYALRRRLDRSGEER